MLTTIEPTLDVALDFTPTLQCEGRRHSLGLHGHQVGAPAAYFMVAPCCGGKVTVCEPRYAAIMAGFGLLDCIPCGLQHLTELYRFLPIEAPSCNG
jgi:hypothetical protein